MFTFNMRRITLLCGCGGGKGCSGLQAGLASPSIAQLLGAPSLSPLQMWSSPHPILPSQRIQTIPSMEGPAGSRAQAAAHMAHHVGCTCVTLRSGLGSANPHGTLREGLLTTVSFSPWLPFETTPSLIRPKGRIFF